jgi:hypothetical protein
MNQKKIPISCTNKQCDNTDTILRIEHDGKWHEKTKHGRFDIGTSSGQLLGYRCRKCGQIHLAPGAKLTKSQPGKPTVNAKMKFKVKGKPGPARWPYSIREDTDGDLKIYTLYNTRTGEDIGLCSAIESLLIRNGNQGLRFTTNCPECDTINEISPKPGSKTICTGCGITIESTGPAFTKAEGMEVLENDQCEEE